MPINPSNRLPLSTKQGEKIATVLASTTAREIYYSLYRSPRTPIEIANEMDISVQTVHYHLGKLADGDLIRQVDIEYSEKGVEMAVYESVQIELVCPATEEDSYSTRSN